MVSRWLSVRPSLSPYVCLSYVHPSVFSFLDNNLSKCQFSPDSNLVCALILWKSGLALLMGNFPQFSTELPVRNR